MNSGGFAGEVSSEFFLVSKILVFLSVKVKTIIKFTSLVTLGILWNHLPCKNNSKSVKIICEQIANS